MQNLPFNDYEGFVNFFRFMMALSVFIMGFCLFIRYNRSSRVLSNLGTWFMIGGFSILFFAQADLVYAEENERNKIREEALTLENALTKTIQSDAKKPVSSANVPGFVRNDPSESSYYTNEQKLRSQTKTVSKSNSVSKSVTESITKRPKVPKEELGNWTSLGSHVHVNPHKFAKGFSGITGNCKTQISGRSTPSTWEYSCDEGVTLGQYTQFCEIPLRAIQSTQYIYHCRSIWNRADCTYEPDPKCSLITLNNSCSKLKLKTTGQCRNERGICGRYCEHKIYESTCSEPISSLQPTETETTPIKFFWDTTACSRLENKPVCTMQSEDCTQKAETKLVGTKPIFKNCWEKTRTYICNETGENTNDCQVPDACSKKTSICLSRNSEDGKCQNWEHNYICQNASPPSGISGYCEEDIYCIDGDCVKSKRPQSNDFSVAVNSLNLIGQVEEDFDTQNLRVFPGKHAKCDKAIAGLQNCCSNDGLLVKLGAGCSNKDHSVARNRQNGQCHQVGTYCSKKTLFGICLKKRKTFCCFNSVLAKTIHEQGRKQIGLDWGNAKFPNCSGYTVANFQKLDLSKLDLSDFYAEVLVDFTGPNSNEVIKAIRERLLSTSKCPPNCPKE